MCGLRGGEVRRGSGEKMEKADSGRVRAWVQVGDEREGEGRIMEE